MATQKDVALRRRGGAEERKRGGEEERRRGGEKAS